MKKIQISLCIIFTTIFAILIHKFLPADANTASTTSFLVKQFGMPVVGVFYFLVLYTQSAFSIYYFGSGSQLSKRDIFLRFGLSYGMIYFIGMIELAPDSLWSIDVGIAQSGVGLGEAIPVLLLALLISLLITRKSSYQNKALLTKKDWPLMAFVSIAVFGVRMICYYMGIIPSAIDRYFWPVLLWTIAFSMTFGLIIALLLPFFQKNTTYKISRIIIIFGLNWFWFNFFIALVKEGRILAICLRIPPDILAISLALLCWNYLKRKV